MHKKQYESIISPNYSDSSVCISVSYVSSLDRFPHPGVPGDFRIIGGEPANSGEFRGQVSCIAFLVHSAYLSGFHH